jgi:RNA polymerase sigma factor (sigma-70 family)
MSELNEIEEAVFEELFLAKDRWTTFGKKFKTKRLSDNERKNAKKILGEQFELFEKLYLPDTTYEERLQVRDELATKNKGLVIHMVKKICEKSPSLGDKTITFKDLVQEGCIGLLRSLESFDLSYGFRFSTHACIWINSYILRHIANNKEAVRVPVHTIDRLNKLKQIEWNLLRKNHTMPTVEDISAEFGKSVKYIERLRKKKRITMSLYSPVCTFKKNYETEFLYLHDDNEASSVIDTIQVKDTTSLVLMIGANKREEIYNVFKKANLSKREILILKSYFGLETREPKTLEEVGGDFDITRERVRQIKAKALRRLARFKGTAHL